jgi:hypothetical protein
MWLGNVESGCIDIAHSPALKNRVQANAFAARKLVAQVKNESTYHFYCRYTQSAGCLYKIRLEFKFTRAFLASALSEGKCWKKATSG